jgi:hypothetical protein
VRRRSRSWPELTWAAEPPAFALHAALLDGELVWHMQPISG